MPGFSVLPPEPVRVSVSVKRNDRQLPQESGAARAVHPELLRHLTPYFSANKV